MDTRHQHLAQSVLLEESGSPLVIRTVILFSAVLVALFIAWAIFAEIDEVAVATGEIVPPSRLKQVQNAEGGRIAEFLVKDGDKVTLGGGTLTAHVTPGHTAGCTTWTFPVTIGGERHEAVLYCSTSVAANRLVSKTKGPQYPGIVADYEQSFAKLRRLKADVFLAPHAEQFGMSAKRARLADGGPNPFIDPGMLQATIAASEKAFRQDLAKQQEAAK